MLIWFSLFVCFFVFGIMYFKKKHCIKQASKSPMASTSTQIASSSSSSIPRWRYDAFLSFYGEDTRKNFTDHLHYALKQKGILVFRDDEKLERGKKVYEELLKAIQESMYAIIVISPNYASSRWCLIELFEIVQCMRGKKLTILPIFYHVDPSDVRNQTGTFAKAFDKHEASLRKKNPKFDIDTMQKWRAALREVGNISGWHVDDESHESEVVEKTSKIIFSGLYHNFSNVSKCLVGIDSRVEEIMSLLSKGGDDVHFLGIYGMGGIGKTTLSKVVYERVSQQFEASCFISGIREETRSIHGLLYLQKQLISEILNEEINIWNEYKASGVIANRVRNKKVFIVLDDVDAEEQLEALAQSHDWFGEGSRIIITSRDCHLLKKHFDNKEIVKRWSFSTFEVKVLNNAEALRLFSWKAFKKPNPEENFVKLSMDIVNYAQGLPLALKVFGSFLFSRTLDEWKSARDLLKENPNVEILDKLKISFDGLEGLPKKLFLDFACFFNVAFIHMKIHRLNSFGYHLDINIKVLAEKSLITISGDDRLRMHDLLQKMGQKIVHDESEQPGGRSRLWHYKDVIHVLKNATGTDAVESIVLKLPLQKTERLNVEAFSKMKNLKMLHISDVDFKSKFPLTDANLRTLEWHGDPSNFMLSNELCVMEWLGYPLKSLPTSFEPENLVELKMQFSNIKQLWDGSKSFVKLKRIDLSYSLSLIETPDLSKVPNLEELILTHCRSLSKVHPSIEFLRRLKRLDLNGCKRLERLPDIGGNMTSLWDLDLSGTAIKKLPLSITSLPSLTYLILFGCLRLDEFPDIGVNMTSLQSLILSGTAIKKLPLSITSLSSLKYLILDGCFRLNEFPDIGGNMTSLQSLNLSGTAIKKLPLSITSLSSLKELILSDCSRLEEIPKDLSGMECLEELEADGTSIRELPSSIVFLKKLKFLNVSGTNIPLSLNSFSGLSSLHRLHMRDCNLSDGAIPSDLSCLSSLDDLDLSGNKFTRLPDSVGQLSHLCTLSLVNCSWLQVLPKLPLKLEELYVKNCPSLEMFYNQMDLWTSNEKFRSIDCTFVADYIDYDGKPSTILHLHPRSRIWINRGPYEREFAYGKVVCGPALLGSGIPEWFKDKSTTDFDFYLDCNSDEWKGYALFIVYQVHDELDTCPKKRTKLKDHEHGSSNSRIFDGSNLNFPYFLCQFQANEVDLEVDLEDDLEVDLEVDPEDDFEDDSEDDFEDDSEDDFEVDSEDDFAVVLCAPGVPSVGPSGFWVYIPAQWFTGMVFANNCWLKASITAGSQNVEVKKCGARVVRQHDVSEFYQVLNSISPHGLDLQSYENLFFHSDSSEIYLTVKGPVKGKQMT